jgi:hypothetical protein
MNSSLAALIRALRGPVLLIAFGVLLALGNLSVIRFGSSWPILVIVYGVMKLAEATAPKDAGSPNPAGGAF